MLVRFLSMKSRKGLASDVVDTFATHSGLVRDVIGTYCLVQERQHSRFFFSSFFCFCLFSFLLLTIENIDEQSDTERGPELSCGINTQGR